LSSKAESQVAEQVQESRIDVVPFSRAVVSKNAVDVRKRRGKIIALLPINGLQAFAGVQVMERKGALAEVCQG
jgi:hypothetical protein